MKQYVDLGLPSGIKWATCNVGATKPEEYGDYFAGGEIKPKTAYSWSTYFDTIDGGSTFTKYTTAGKTMLDLEDDAAHVVWGGEWRMPTNEEWTELCNNCTWIWTILNGVNGYKVKSKINGNSIFLPAAGYRYSGSLGRAGSCGFYWSSSLYTDSPYYAWYVSFSSDYVGRDDYGRYYGQSVRPVYVESESKESKSSKEQDNIMKEMVDWSVIRKTCLYLEEITRCPVEITGSYILKKGGLIDRAPSDVDIRIAMDSTKFEHLCYLLQGKPTCNSDYGVNSFYIKRGELTLNLCLVQNLNTAFKWDEVNVTSYDHIIKWKLDHQREKDLKDLVIIKERLSKIDDCFKYQVNKDTVDRLIAVVKEYLSNEAKKSVQ